MENVIKIMFLQRKYMLSETVSLFLFSKFSRISCC